MRSGLSRLRHRLSGDRRRGRLEDERMWLVLAGALRPDSCCVDVGANVGGFLGMCRALAPRGRHVAYEPIPTLADDLRSRFPADDIRAAAVADERRIETFSHIVDAPARSGLGRRDQKGDVENLQVDVVTLDEDLPADFVPRLIKIDVEGTEVLAIRGAAETIRRHRPLVLFEHGWHAWSADLHAAVDGLDLDIFDLFGHGPYRRGAFVEAIGNGVAINFLARPR
jgi:FkbM family methyltransferase